MAPIHLPSPILTLCAPFHSLALSDHLFPPLLNHAALIYHPLSSRSSSLFPFTSSVLHFMLLCSSVSGEKKQIWTTLWLLWSLANDKLPGKSQKLPLRVEEGKTQTNRDTCREEIVQYLMFLCDSCLLEAHASAVNLETLQLHGKFSGHLGAQTPT